MNPPAAPVHLAQPRLLFYAVNGLGLGHVTRLLAIARAVRARRPGAQLLFITTSEADDVIYREGFAAVKIPSRGVAIAGRLQPGSYLKLAHTVVTNAVASFNPAVLVADTFPAGASHELLPALYWEMRRVFVYRAQQAAAASDPAFQQALGAYHLAIVPHAAGSESQGVAAPAGLPLVWTGPILIRDRADALTRAEARARLGLPADGPLLYVAAGGGGDEAMAAGGEAVIVQAARAAGWGGGIVAPDAPLRRPGPDPAARGAVAADGSARPDYRVSYYPMAECLPAFDAAASAAGYNSVEELLHFGVPSVLIARPRGLDDQHARAEAAAARGAALVGDLDARRLTATLRALLQEPGLRQRLGAAALRGAGDNGAGRAADAILGLL